MREPLRLGRGGLLLAVRVTPKSSANEVTGLHRGADGAVSLAVKVTAPPDKGKANEAVIAVLAKVSGLPRRAFTLVSGEASRDKLILVTGNPAPLEAMLAALNA